MTWIKPRLERPHHTGVGVQRIYVFRNGYGASVVRFCVGSFGAGSYGHEQGLWELGVMERDGKNYFLTCDTPITDDVLGDLTDQEVIQVLRRIKQLPCRIKQLPQSEQP